MLSFFWKAEPQYAYKRYAYKKHVFYYISNVSLNFMYSRVEPTEEA